MDDDAKYRALLARDARFDGVFYVGVTTTGIYCRPVCRARTPMRSRCVFFRHAAEAERAGFRACFRCRPELAPSRANATDAVSWLARAAIARIEAGALNDASLDDLARDLGASSRHVRRALQREVGVSPAELAETARLALAKQLLHDEAMTMTEIAYASGFSSVRRFNAAFRARFGRAPSSLQKRRAESHDTIALTLGYRAPLAWTALLRFLDARAMPGVERVDLTAQTYARTARIAGATGTVVARKHARRDAIVIEASASLARSLMPIASRAKRLFDLDAEPHAIGSHLARDVALKARVQRTPGLRVPGAWDGFEIAVRAVLGQQISVRAATTLAGRFARAFGARVASSRDGLDVAFPDARTVASAKPAEIRAIGVTASRAKTIASLAQAFANGRLALGGDPNDALASLESIDGVGRWTAQYVAMRALGAPDAFPHGDLGLVRALDLTPRALRDRSLAWSPWRAYAAMHLWNEGALA